MKVLLRIGDLSSLLMLNLLPFGKGDRSCNANKTTTKNSEDHEVRENLYY